MLKIHTRKFVFRGALKREILSVEGLMDPEIIPFEYYETFPKISNERLITANKTYPVIGKGQVYDESVWQEMLPLIREAGEKLHRLRAKEKILKKEWQGEETFVI